MKIQVHKEKFSHHAIECFAAGGLALMCIIVSTVAFEKNTANMVDHQNGAQNIQQEQIELNELHI